MKKKYEKPVIELQSDMKFPQEMWDAFCKGKWCFGCTNCNCN